MSFLSKLKIVHNTQLDASNPIHRRRMKLIENLKEQQMMVQAMIDKKPFTKMKKVWVPDKNGEDVKKLMPQQVRQWYWQHENTYYIQCFFGRRKLSLRNGKAAVVAGETAESLMPTIGVLICAVEAGEIDEALKDAYIKKPAK